MEKLREVQLRVRPDTVYNDSNIDCIEAQIRVLEEEMKLGEAVEEWPRALSWYLNMNAREAVAWLNDPRKECLARNWETLTRKDAGGKGPD